GGGVGGGGMGARRLRDAGQVVDQGGSHGTRKKNGIGRNRSGRRRDQPGVVQRADARRVELQHLGQHLVGVFAEARCAHRGAALGAGEGGRRARRRIAVAAGVRKLGEEGRGQRQAGIVRERLRQ